MILGAHVSIAGGVANAPTRAKSIGAESMQIFTKNQNRWQGKALETDDVDEYLRLIEELNIKWVLSHDSYLINLCSPDPAKLKASRDAFEDELDRADRLDIPYLVAHPGSHLGKGERYGIDLIAESINFVLDKNSSGSTMVLLETTAGQGTNIGYKFEHLAEIRKMVENKNRIGVCLDTCHIFAAGYDFRTESGYDSVMREFQDVIGIEHLKAIHLNDSKRDLGTRVDRHDSIGKGIIGEKAFEYFVRDQRLARIPGVLETPGGMDEYELELKLLGAMEIGSAAVK